MNEVFSWKQMFPVTVLVGIQRTTVFSWRGGQKTSSPRDVEDSTTVRVFPPQWDSGTTVVVVYINTPKGTPPP